MQKSKLTDNARAVFLFVFRAKQLYDRAESRAKGAVLVGFMVGRFSRDAYLGSHTEAEQKAMDEHIEKALELRA